jgi:hypothetical protein
LAWASSAMRRMSSSADENSNMPTIRIHIARSLGSRSLGGSGNDEEQIGIAVRFIFLTRESLHNPYEDGTGLGTKYFRLFDPP